MNVQCPIRTFSMQNNTLKDIRNIDQLMGGIPVLLAGDFRQTLPAIKQGISHFTHLFRHL